MNTSTPKHFMTLANAREHIIKLEEELANSRKEIQRLKPAETAKVSDPVPPRGSPYQRHLNVSSVYTPEETAAYKEGIVQAEFQLASAKDAYRAATTIAEQYRALALIHEAKINLEEKKRPPVPKSRQSPSQG